MPGASETFVYTQYHSYLELESSFVTMAWRDSVCFTWEQMFQFYAIFGFSLRRELIVLTHKLPKIEAYVFDCFFQYCLEIENTQFSLNLSMLD